MKHTPEKQVRAAAADFLRVLSIALIAWYHFWQQSWLNPNFTVFGYTVDLYPIIRCGYMFVYNLILISGFLLMLNRLNGKYASVGQFYKSRAVRILPSYLFCIAVFLFASNMSGGTYDWDGGKEHMRLDLISHLTFTQNLFTQSYSGTGLNVALWTVAVEVQFYAFFPLLGKCFEKRPVLTYACMVAVSVLFRLYVHVSVVDSTMFVNRLPAMLDVFADGMMGAYVYNKLKDRKKLSCIHLLICIAAMIGMFITVRDVSYTGGGEEARRAQMWGASLLSAFAAVFLVSGSLCSMIVRVFFSNPPIRFLSALTYNFYIWHQPIAVWLKKLHIPNYTEEFPNKAGNVQWQRHYMLLCVACALFVAFRTTYLIEKPCARWLNAHRISNVRSLFHREISAEGDPSVTTPEKVI